MFIKEFIEILLEGGLLILLAAAGLCLFESTQDEEIHEEKWKYTTHKINNKEQGSNQKCSVILNIIYFYRLFLYIFSIFCNSSAFRAFFKCIKKLSFKKTAYII